jgi:hypothetical protein
MRVGRQYGKGVDNHGGKPKVARPCLLIELVPMYLASDYIHPTPRGGRCCTRIYLPDDERDSPVVVCSELPAEYTPLFEAGSQGEMDA